LAAIGIPLIQRERDNEKDAAVKTALRNLYAKSEALLLDGKSLVGFDQNPVVRDIRRDIDEQLGRQNA